jgi:hypothetical protein
MTTSTLAPSRSRLRGHLRFAGHYLEMVVAMFLGMALGPLWSFLVPGIDDRPDVRTMVMATDMAIGMTLWMLIRRHSWRHIAEMSGAMYAPFVLLLGPYWLGAISSDTLMMVGHVLMFPAMLVPMILRRQHYYGQHAAMSHAHH